jgi:hypothetical protein
MSLRHRKPDRRLFIHTEGNEAEECREDVDGGGLSCTVGWKIFNTWDWQLWDGYRLVTVATKPLENVSIGAFKDVCQMIRNYRPGEVTPHAFEKFKDMIVSEFLLKGGRNCLVGLKAMDFRTIPSKPICVRLTTRIDLVRQNRIHLCVLVGTIVMLVNIELSHLLTADGQNLSQTNKEDLLHLLQDEGVLPGSRSPIWYQ